MICYLVRHGKDDDSLRGGWSTTPLTEEGIAQMQALAHCLAVELQSNIAQVFTSDLLRAKQSAEIIAQRTNASVVLLPQFREVNNGLLAGMNNADAATKWPGLFWNTLDWDQCYPDGESPHLFYDRIHSAWHRFVDQVQKQGEDVVLVTHGGVINLILHIVNGLEYSNKTKPFSVKHAELIPIQL